MVCSPAICETTFSFDKDMWIAATNFYMCFCIIVLFPSIAILQLMNFMVLKIISPGCGIGASLMLFFVTKLYIDSAGMVIHSTVYNIVLNTV